MTLFILRLAYDLEHDDRGCFVKTEETHDAFGVIVLGGCLAVDSTNPRYKIWTL